jgi:hypothetical protein
MNEDIKTEPSPFAREELAGSPADCASGVRHRGGVILIQARVWNVGTCGSDAKEEIQAEDP